jgi:SAM-dependent methyltransferase
MISEKIYRLLEIPFVYRLSQFLLAPGINRLMKPVHQKLFSRSEGKVLDVGCGPTLTTPEPDGLLVGVDINETYLKDYTGGFLDTDPHLVLNRPLSRRRLGFAASAERLPFADESFDEARSNGLFHHLPDEIALRAFREMYRCVRSGGRIVILDAVWPLRVWTRPIAWLTRRFDRGPHVRSQEEMLRLSQNACPGDWEWERRTGTYSGLEYLFLQYVKR